VGDFSKLSGYMTAPKKVVQQTGSYPFAAQITQIKESLIG
jgi:hypothetical protein